MTANFNWTNPGGSSSNALTSMAYGFWPSDAGAGAGWGGIIDSLLGATLTGLQAGGVIDLGGGMGFHDDTSHPPITPDYREGAVMPSNGFCQTVTRQTAPGVRMKKVVQVMKPNGEMTNYIHAGTAKTFSLASFKSRRSKRCCPR